jgi:hypothetical protein
MCVRLPVPVDFASAHKRSSRSVPSSLAFLHHGNPTSRISMTGIVGNRRISKKYSNDWIVRRLGKLRALTETDSRLFESFRKLPNHEGFI